MDIIGGDMHFKFRDWWETAIYYFDDVVIALGIIGVFISPYLAYLGHPMLAMGLIIFAIMRFC